jgi:hypothetical protein
MDLNDFHICDWDCFHKGKRPRYWRYVSYGACHWLVNFNLRLAELAEPKRKWRILTSEFHSTVFDGNETLFEMNLMAFGVSAQECYHLAVKDSDNRKAVELRIGQLYPTSLPLLRGK